MTTIDHAADAILALINSRPSSPTKAEIAAIIARVPAIAFEPTELGSELLRRIPLHVAGVAKDIASGGRLYAAGDEEVANLIEAADPIVDAINERWATSLSHLIDLAIVARFRGYDEHYETDEVEDYVAAHVAIVRFLLQAAGIPEAACSVNVPAFTAASSKG